MLTKIETIRVPVQPNLLLVLVTDDQGETGLGESFFGAQAVDAYVHETAAPILLASNHTAPEAVACELRSYVGYQGSGVETRGNAAIDVALWDLLGKQSGRPLANLLGGPLSASIPVYNTCAGPSYVREQSRQWSGNWGLKPAGRGRRFEDLQRFMNDPAGLTCELMELGYRAMKIWPFDEAAERSRGTDITHEELQAGLNIVRQVREVAGDRMRVMVELHGLWLVPAAKQILAGLAEFAPYWVEDPVRPDAVDGLRSLADSTDLWIATGETVAGRRGFLPLLQRRAIDVVTVDVQWCGGVTEAQKIATLADTFGMPVAPHDCTGPVTLAASAHLVMSQPNGLIQETARAFINTWYRDIADGVPDVSGGVMSLSTRPGHGVLLRPGLRDVPGAKVRVSARS